jgi:hypothetical protein
MALDPARARAEANPDRRGDEPTGISEANVQSAAVNRPAIAPRRTTPGHDPQFRLTRRVAGKSVTESFPNPAALRKAQQEVAEFHRFQKLGEDLVSVNERICALRPVEAQHGGWTDQEKKRLLQSIRKLRGK